MKTSMLLFLIVGAIVSSSAIVQNGTQTPEVVEEEVPETGAEDYYVGEEEMGATGEMPVGVDMTGAMAAATVYAQQSYYALYATSLLELQASWAWVHVSEGMSNMATASIHGRADPSGIMSFEEGAENIEKGLSSESSFLQEDEEEVAGGVSGMAELVERQTEQALLQLVKLMYVQAAHRLGSAQELHYENKVIILQIAPYAQAAPVIGQLVYVMYYRDMLELIMSAVTLQKQDAWNTWVFHEMMETELFQDEEPAPAAFSRRMAFARRQAMSQFQTQAGLELAAITLEFYLTSLVSQISGVAMQNYHMSQMAQATAQSSQSFLELESQSQAQFVPSMALGGLFGWKEFLPYAKFYTAWTKYHVASSLAMLSHVDALALLGKDQGQARHTPYLMAHQVTPMLKQWAQLRLMLALYDFYSQTGATTEGMNMNGMGIGHAHHAHHNAAFSNLVQEDAKSASVPTPAATDDTSSSNTETEAKETPTQESNDAKIEAEDAKVEKPDVAEIEKIEEAKIEKVEEAVPAEMKEEEPVTEKAVEKSSLASVDLTAEEPSIVG